MQTNSRPYGLKLAGIRASFKIALALCLCFLTASLFSRTRAQNFSNLQGKELTRVNENDLVTSGLSRLLGGKIEGSINRVVVTDDRERRLVVKVTYTGLDGTSLSGEVQGSDKRTQREIRSTPVNLTAATTEAELTFDLKEGLPEGTTLQSALLVLSVSKRNRAPGLVQSYSLPKSWQVSIRPENVVIRITPRAESAAAPPADPTTAPGHTLPPPRMITLSPKERMVLRDRADMTSIRSDALSTRVDATRATDTAAIQAEVQSKQKVVEKTDVAAKQLPTNAELKAVNVFRYGLSREITDKSGRGPSSAAIPLLTEIRVGPGVDVPNEQLTKLSPLVFRDQNPNSGIFYFIPRAYHVYWDPDQGYGMRMLYGEAARDGQEGDVLMSMLMDAKVGNDDVQFARELLQAYQARHPEVRFTELRQLPIEEPPKISLAGDLQHQYNISPDKIAIISISDVLGQIKVSWITDPRTRNFMKLALEENVGINGTVSFKPAGGGNTSTDIPIEINLADPATFGDLRWRRGQTIRNQTPYPMRLKYLHALTIVNNVPTVYSWGLDNTTVPPQAQVEIDGSPIPAWLDGRAKRIWIDYTPIENCQPCDEQVISAITNGVGDRAASQITFRTLTPLADVGAYEISLRVRSKYFDPRGRDMQEKPPIVLNADNRDFTVGPFYSPGTPPDAARGEHLFEYFIEVTMPDGTSHSSTRWMPADSLRVPIGKAQIERALGSLPTPPSASPSPSAPSPGPASAATPEPTPAPAAGSSPTPTPAPTPSC